MCTVALILVLSLERIDKNVEGRTAIEIILTLVGIRYINKQTYASVFLVKR